MRRASVLGRGLLPLVAALATALSACHARPRSWSPGKEGASRSGTSSSSGVVAELDLTHGVPEKPGGGLFAGASRSSFFHLVRQLERLEDDDRAKGVFVRFGGARVGWSRADELGDALARVRKSGKPVVCHAEGWTNSTAWIAARGCDRIWVSPAGEVETVGIAAQVVYARRLLADKLGVDIDFLQIGKFKGAEEPLTRDGPSPEARESLETTLAAIRKRWLGGFAARGAGLDEAAEDGPFGADDAKRRGLVDAVGYLDDARSEAKKRAGTERAEVRWGHGASAAPRSELVELIRGLAGEGTTRSGAPHVAVLRAVGSIAMDGGGGLGEGPGITEKALGRAVRDLAEDDAAMAVVLRVDSPGGSALASDLLWHALMELREKKPLVVSVGDMAASGGYYLASTGQRIVAAPTSIVGSIGVVGGKLAFGHALEQVGVHVETFGARPDASAASRAAYASALTTWDDATRERVRASMRSVYDLFLARVAEGRGVPVEKIAASAEGRIFAGDDAMARGLVDEWGGLGRAIVVARELAKLPEDAPVRLVGERSGIFDLLGLDDESDDGDDEEARVRAATRKVVAAWTDELAPEVGATVGSWLPLARGERALTALPFGILVR